MTCVLLALPLALCVVHCSDPSTNSAEQQGDLGALGADAGPSDSGTTGQSVSDASPDAAAPLGYHDITNAAFWKTFPINSLPSLVKCASGGGTQYAGSAFDGRYLYLVPATASCAIIRFDTTRDFALPTSYEQMIPPGGSFFTGAVFDGKYIYFIPDGSVMLRYDTTTAFTSPSSYATFDLKDTGAPATIAFNGGTFDGRYVYLAPQGTNAFSGYAVRYDTQGAFSTASSYEAYDMEANGQGRGVRGAVFDGRYVYYVDWVSHGVTRYDTQASFAKAGFSVFQLPAHMSGATSDLIAGGVFDGRYLTIVPAGNDFIQYDTRGAFENQSSWSFLDPHVPGAYATSFAGGLFDGRYVYMAPWDGQSKVLRHDTQAPFATGWSSFDIATVEPAAKNGFFTAAFDGPYAYFLPNASYGQVLARFDTKSAAPMPSTYHGSFY
jgi:hypothetical protein